MATQALIIIGVFVVCLFLGFPIFFSVCIPSILALLMNDLQMVMVPKTIIGGVQSFTLLAVPFFILAGNLMNSGGITKRIFDICLALMGWIRGGLAYVNVLASMVFAGISGSAAADAAGLGKIEMQAMKDDGFDASFAAAITAASSVIGPIIPPSIIMILYATEANVNVSDMFKAGIIPGILVGLMLMAACKFMFMRGEKAPPATKFSWKRLGVSLKDGVLAIIAPAIILMGMFSGSFSPTEAGIVAVVYSTVVGMIYKELKLKDIPRIIKESAIAAAQVMFMTSAASLLSWTLTFTKIPLTISKGILSFTDSRALFMLIVVVFLLILGCFIESMAGLLIVMPVMIPIATVLGIDLVHFGIVCCLSMMIGAVTPPMGACVFIVCSISETRFDLVCKKLWPFLISLVVALLLVAYVEPISTLLPHLLTKG